MNNKQIIKIFLAMSAILLLVVSCAPKTTQPTSTDGIDQELSQMSEQQLKETANAKSAPSSIAGQASYNPKNQITLPRDKYLQLKASQQLVQKYDSSQRTEICNDNKDNNGNNLVDCNDILACYSPQSAPNNICSGATGTVLLNGLSLGFASERLVKADKTKNIQYSDGENACMLTLGKKCLSIESYQDQKWKPLSTEELSCSTPLIKFPKVAETYYRAVCVQGTVTPPGPPSVSGGMISK